MVVLANYLHLILTFERMFLMSLGAKIVCNCHCDINYFSLCLLYVHCTRQQLPSCSNLVLFSFPRQPSSFDCLPICVFIYHKYIRPETLKYWNCSPFIFGYEYNEDAVSPTPTLFLHLTFLIRLSTKTGRWRRTFCPDHAEHAPRACGDNFRHRLERCSQIQLLCTCWQTYLEILALAPRSVSSSGWSFLMGFKIAVQTRCLST